jgi:hypothetical protein
MMHHPLLRKNTSPSAIPKEVQPQFVTCAILEIAREETTFAKSQLVDCLRYMLDAKEDFWSWFWNNANEVGDVMCTS